MRPHSYLKPLGLARLLVAALLLFGPMPLLHAHPMGQLPQGHVGGLHGPATDFANAAVGEDHFVPDPVVVAEALRADEDGPSGGAPSSPGWAAHAEAAGVIRIPSAPFPSRAAGPERPGARAPPR